MRGLMISGVRPEEHIRFTALPEISNSSFEVTASVQGRSVMIPCVSLLDLEKLLAALSQFEQTRSSAAILEGTYGFRLVVHPHGRTGGAWIGFCLIDDPFLEDGTQGRHTLEAGFAIPGESVGRFVRDLGALLTLGHG